MRWPACDRILTADPSWITASATDARPGASETVQRSAYSGLDPPPDPPHNGVACPCHDRWGATVMSETLDPRLASSSAEYVQLLRRLKNRSGLSYRDLARRAAASGDPLPASSIATMLGRESLPREAMVSALVRACGGSADEIALWVAERKRLAEYEAVEPEIDPVHNSASTESFASDKSHEESENTGLQVDEKQIFAVRRKKRPRNLEVVRLAVLALSLPLLVWGVLALVRQPPPVDATKAAGPATTASKSAENPVRVAIGPDMPAAGDYRIIVVASGLCLAERARHGSGQVFQAPCENAIPRYSLQPLGGSRFRILPTHPRNGPGCMGVPRADRKAGDRIFDDACGRGADENFTFAYVDQPVIGYRIKAARSGLCLTIEEGSNIPWVELRQRRCNDSLTGQVFRFAAR